MTRQLLPARGWVGFATTGAALLFGVCVGILRDTPDQWLRTLPLLAAGYCGAMALHLGRRQWSRPRAPSSMT